MTSQSVWGDCIIVENAAYYRCIIQQWSQGWIQGQNGGVDFSLFWSILVKLPITIGQAVKTTVEIFALTMTRVPDGSIKVHLSLIFLLTMLEMPAAVALKVLNLALPSCEWLTKVVAHWVSLFCYQFKGIGSSFNGLKVTRRASVLYIPQLYMGLTHHRFIPLKLLIIYSIVVQ